MNKEDPYRVQAELQKQRLKKVTKEEEKSEERAEESSLPSRSAVHKNKKKKFKVPIISLLAFIFVLLPVVLLLINSLLNGKDFSNLLSTENTPGLFENVNIQKENPSNNKSNQDKTEEGEQEELVIDSNTTETEEEEDVPTDNSKEKTVEEEDKATKETTESEQTSENPPKNEETEEVMEQANANEKIVYHTVEKGENLYRIALKYFPNGDGIEKIKSANNMTNDQVQLGQTLKIVLEQ